MSRIKSRPGIFHRPYTLLDSLESRQLLSGLINGSFESPGVSGFAYQPAGTGWAFSGSSGIQANGSIWGAPAAPNGTQAAYLQTGSQIDQTFNAAVSGAYTFSFQGALRSYRSAGAAPQQVAVYLDGSYINTFAPTSTTSWNSFSFSQNLALGNHTLSFRTGKTSLAWRKGTYISVGMSETSVCFTLPTTPTTIIHGTSFSGVAPICIFLPIGD
jgi:hypothetical protein